MIHKPSCLVFEECSTSQALTQGSPLFFQLSVSVHHLCSANAIHQPSSAPDSHAPRSSSLISSHILGWKSGLTNRSNSSVTMY
ncbi:hypothetical protein QGX23_gp009 [Pseudomonas phage PN09]|uniref:Uncharacterized protein n=1 Tax=Pseudomonas phage PN09 TaxID=2782564 RepID=A0A7S7YBT7_9CAUD|nr:hypothetical protein QGX23_gp009 [Pseudomonas phage PN09]QPB10430.1 hypothetical protein PN09_009 [Pseudomonas phage PN09]